MVGRLLLAAALAIPGPLSASIGDGDGDIESGGLLGTIVSDTGGGRVDLEGTYGWTSEPGTDSDEAGQTDQLSEADTPPPSPANCSPNNLALCAGDPAAPPDEPAAPVVVTLRDIASFRPATPGNGMEPGGWAVVGLPANFVAAASVEVVSGTLLGQPADVRFTPVGYRWSHSDGGIVESGTPGASWEVLGQREFSPTPTSHVYAASGEYTAELEVALRAEYRFAGSPWRSIAGTLAVAGPPQRVLVGEFDTVLTRGDCNDDPSGPGC